VSFLVFYIASSYAVSQERVHLIVTEMQHSTSRDGDVQFDDGCKQLRNGYPNFQRAKPKSLPILCFGNDPVLHQPAASNRDFHVHPTPSLESLYRGQRILSRAPPSHR
jgi:hypothetical protein